ncbi:hypothetical protein BHU72_11830 [Desulfuribacillus stibiiarsenatis]|uniref:Uncharacterized protein n=1 Tax=Desulfuribacillus stibiiarsenatis TaxID=1390249 RepID=A0A1E5L832_9FIRM|nr:hypothetical protein [Desulfuribacillus stibiiarsenatis]OEH86218.1 hypothetical protein BHU72_11830 [Desulfuribacillus stibiiarsenatis]
MTKKLKSRSNEPIIILPPKVYIRETGETVPMTDEHRKILAKRKDQLLINLAKQEVMKELGYGS